MPVADDERPSVGELLAAVSNLAVGVYADLFGRGPTKARTYVAGEVIVCLMEDTMLKVEKTLVEGGGAETVLQMRTRYQETMRRKLCEGIERLTGRRVTAFISGNSLEPDIWSELFVLDGPPDTRTDPADPPPVPAAKLVRRMK